MIPDFDKNGNLPPGIHLAEFDEVTQRFGGSISLKRRSLTNNLEVFYDFIKDFAVCLYIDRSYVTSKLAPNDVDSIVILPDDFVSDSHRGRRLLRFIKNKTTYHLHVFPCMEDRPDQQVKSICWFTKDRNDNPKGIVYVGIRK